MGKTRDRAGETCEKEGAAARSCYGLIATSHPLRCWGEEKVEGSGMSQ